MEYSTTILLTIMITSIITWMLYSLTLKRKWINRGKSDVKKIILKSYEFPINGKIGYLNNTKGVLIFEDICGDSFMRWVRIIDDKIDKTTKSFQTALGDGIIESSFDGITCWVYLKNIRWIDESDLIKRNSKLSELLSGVSGTKPDIVDTLDTVQKNIELPIP